MGRKRVSLEGLRGYDILRYSKDRNLTRVDPDTNRVVTEIPIEAGSPDGGAYHKVMGEGALRAHADSRLFRVNPATDEVTAKVSLGDSSSHLAVRGGAV